MFFMTPQNDEIPEMNLDEKGKYSSKGNILPESDDKVRKEMEKTKKELEKLKGYILKKYPFTQSISIMPPASIKLFIEEEEVPKETEKHVHVLVIIPEEKFKNIQKIRSDILEQLEKFEQKIWLHVKTPIDIWEYCLDSKFDLASAIAMSYPLYDRGILGALRVAEVHKSLVLRKFDKYVVSYVIGGSLVRGEAIKTSDVDVFIIINDTDVKRMPRMELKERLRSFIYQYVSEASAIAGVKNVLSPQIYLLTEFWESVKDTHPVIFTFIRDGIPLYDRQTFMPWKALLKMGKLKPSPEAIDMFMSMGDKTVKRAKNTLLDIVIGDIYWGVITPSQALLMLYGLPPPNIRETVNEMKKIFVDKEKMLEKKYIDILEEIAIKYYKGYEHGKIKEISGKEIDKLLKNTEDYLKRLKELRDQIEKSTQEKTILQIYEDVIHLLQSILKKKEPKDIEEAFEKEFVKTGKFPRKHMEFLKNIFDAKKNLKKEKVNIHKSDNIRKEAAILMNGLIDYSQRCELVLLEKGRMKIKYKSEGKDKYTELFNCNGQSFLFLDGMVKKLTDKIEKSNPEEAQKALNEQKDKKLLEFNPKIFELVRKEVGDFEIVL